MSANWIRGYADRPSARPGETLSFFISCSSPGPFDARVVRLRHGDVSPEGPGYREAPTPVAPLSGLPGICQRTQVGSYIEIPDPRGNLSGSRGLTIRLSMWPTTPAKRQGVISRWSERDRSGWAVMVE
ncbi:MAG TPA: hypothetical protein VHB68_07480, partial [Steroidobacteraceae bacterium]|nr:hypothetical protein [Steroidobacteraceae bacterium]